MIRRARVILAGAAIAGAGCAPATPAVDVAAEEQAVREASGQWMAAVQAKDWAAAAAMLAPDGAVYPANQQPLVGPAAAQAEWEREMGGMPNATISWATEKVTVAASGDLALETGTWTFANEGAQDTGKYITVWQKVSGEWKAIADMGVSTMPEDTAGGM